MCKELFYEPHFPVSSKFPANSIHFLSKIKTSYPGFLWAEQFILQLWEQCLISKLVKVGKYGKGSEIK
jgi:hypothetical protein